VHITITLFLTYLLRSVPSDVQLFIQAVHVMAFFTALHGMQTRSSDENSVRLSVRLSVCHTRELWQNSRKICPHLYTIRKII